MIAPRFGRLILLLVLLAGAALVIPTSAQTTPLVTRTPTPPFSVVLPDDIYVRSGPGSGFPTVGSLRAGHVMRPLNLSEDGQWVLIAYGRGVGWVRRDLGFWVEAIDELPVLAVEALTLTPVDSAPEATLFIPTTTPEGNWVRLQDQAAYLRAGPGLRYPIVDSMPSGTVLETVGRDAAGDWIMVRQPDGFAWVFRPLVSWADDLTTLPILIPPFLTPSPTFTRTPRPTRTPTFTATHTPTITPTLPPTVTATATLPASLTPSPSPTMEPTATSSATRTPQPTHINSATSTREPTMLALVTNTPFTGTIRPATTAPTRTARATLTSAASSKPTATATRTEPPPTATLTPSPTNTATATRPPTRTASPTASITNTPRPTMTATVTASATPAPTVTPTNTFAPTETAPATETAVRPLVVTPRTATRTTPPTRTPTPTSTSSATATRTTAPTLTVTPTATSTITLTRTAAPTRTPTTTRAPANTPAEAATALSGQVGTLLPETAVVAPSATFTPTPTASRTPAPTRTSSSTPPATSTSTATPTRTVAPTATATSTVTAAPTRTLSPAVTSTATMSTPSTATPESTPETTAVVIPDVNGPAEPPTPAAPVSGNGPAILIGIVALAGIIIYGVLYWRGAVAADRYKNGFIIHSCPVCGRGELEVETRVGRIAGIPRPMHTVRCDSCRSLLREVRPGRWRYAVDPMENVDLAARYNGKIISAAALRTLDLNRRGRGPE